MFCKVKLDKIFIKTLVVWSVSMLHPTAANSQEAEPIFPIPQNIELDERKVQLGDKLFHDPILSSNGKISCASCHNLNKGGADKLKVSVGVSGEPGKIHSPTLFNIGEHFNLFWDGRAHTLEEQIDGPIKNPDEMNSNWETIIKKLSLNENYKKQFLDIYRSPPSEKSIKNAIATFEKSLITPGAPFDKYLQGDKSAISDLAQKGYDLFKSYGCVACHQGRDLGANMFQKFGVIGDYFKDRGTPITEADFGRYNVTNDEFDKHVFKVPSLRNIALTAPYFHDGSAQTLEEAVNIMAKYQLGRELSAPEEEAIVAFLKSLTGTYKGKKLSAE